MAITINDLTINPSGLDRENLLSDWEWNAPEKLLPVLVTAMGDVFAQGESGVVYYLDAVAGTIEPIAKDGGDFQTLLSDKDFVVDHFFPSRVISLREAGLKLEPQEVYSHKTPLVLGGADDIDNVEVSHVAVYLGMMGQIHEQVKNLPDGTPINQIRIE